ncbi:MAG: peptide deformylase [Ruminococcaceae bacterium]|nr:peptide deformylase [Oscillospiraceae bacterium]
MIKEMMHDPIFLAGKSEVATKEDLQVAQDLLDTLMAHKESCVGMAANMIGVRKRIIAFLDESGRTPTYTVMLNPEIIKKDGAYDTEEGCLSLLGGPRKCKRYKTIKVQYLTQEREDQSIIRINLGGRSLCRLVVYRMMLKEHAFCGIIII